MSDERTPSTEAASLAELAAHADQLGDGRPRTPDVVDPVVALREHCKAFIDGANLTVDARGHALTKLSEMVFWLQTGVRRE